MEVFKPNSSRGRDIFWNNTIEKIRTVYYNLGSGCINESLKHLYLTTNLVQRVLNKTNQTDYSIVSPTLTNYQTGHGPDWSQKTTLEDILVALVM